MRLNLAAYILCFGYLFACSEPSVRVHASENEEDLHGDETRGVSLKQFGAANADNNPPQIELLNITAGGELNSGSLAGRCFDDFGVQVVQVKYDDSDFIEAEGGIEWKFELPQKNLSWRQGSVHRVSVRCIDTSDNISKVVDLLVRQGPRRDIDGDGFSDLVFGSPTSSLSKSREDIRNKAEAGSLYIILGKVKGFGSLATTTADVDSVILGEGAFFHFGSEISIGDFNGDGLADIAASEPDFDAGKGRVSITLGQKSLPIEGKLSDYAAQFINGHSNTGSLGRAIATSDINNDGFDDLIVSQSSSPGRVFILQGGESSIAYGLNSLGTSYAVTTLIGTTSSFGHVLVSCDIDRDGTNDVIVGEPNSSGGGRLFVFSGSPSGLQREAKYIVSANDKLEVFAQEIVCGDFNGDFLNDLAISLGAHNSDDKGKVIVLSGEVWSEVGQIDVNVAITRRQALILTGKEKTEFGSSLAIADFDRNGMMDLIVGAPAYDSGRGRTYIFEGFSDFFRIKKTTRQRTTAFFTGSDTGEGLGTAIAAEIDYNHDGQPDLILGSPKFSSNPNAMLGRIYVIYSPLGGFSADAQVGAIADGIITGDTPGLSIGRKFP